jgi:F0F1-type ATP synthase assembly protein I
MSRSADHRPVQPIRNTAGSFLTMGLQLAGAVVVFFFIGYWLDRRLLTAPWLSVGGAVFGAVGGMIKFIRDAMKAGAQDDREAMKRRNERGW